MFVGTFDVHTHTCIHLWTTFGADVSFGSPWIRPSVRSGVGFYSAPNNRRLSTNARRNFAGNRVNTWKILDATRRRQWEVVNETCVENAEDRVIRFRPVIGNQLCEPNFDSRNRLSSIAIRADRIAINDRVPAPACLCACLSACLSARLSASESIATRKSFRRERRSHAFWSIQVLGMTGSYTPNRAGGEF